MNLLLTCILLLSWCFLSLSVTVNNKLDCNRRMNMCHITLAMPTFVDIAVKKRLGEGINYKTSIENLKEFLKKTNLIEDEKEWDDRPIKKIPNVLNSVEFALDELKKVEKTLNKAQANKILDRYFDPISSEVQSLNLEQKDSNIFAEVSPEANSILYTALERLAIVEQDTIDYRVWTTMAHYALSELMKLGKSIGSEKQRSSLNFKKYTDEEVDSFVTETFMYLNSTVEGKITEKSKIFDRTFNWDQALHRSSSTLIPLPFPSIVPGGRFSEVYYWDSYWVLRGLASAGKLEFMMNQVNNYFYMIDTYGFVPNGARTYYLDRSQPPLLSEMVMVIINYLSPPSEFLRRVDFAKQALPRLITEYLGFWMNPVTKHVIDLISGTTESPTPNATATGEVIFQILNKVSVYLNRYHSSLTEPRPESYLADNSLRRAYSELKPVTKVSPDKIMQNIRTAAESGWDFSSRWNRKFVEGHADAPTNDKAAFFQHLDTSNIIPSDLNSILVGIEKTISKLLEIVDLQSESSTNLQELFFELSTTRSLAIKQYSTGLTDLGRVTIHDLDLKSKLKSRVISAASVMTSVILNLTNAHLPEELAGRGGIYPTPNITNEQWDKPNAWPPLQTYFHGFETHPWHGNGTIPRPMFWDATILFIVSVKKSFTSLLNSKSTKGYFFEKYNADLPGTGGSGGEYVNQVGFGWTNGLILEFFSRFSSSINIWEIAAL